MKQTPTVNSVGGPILGLSEAFFESWEDAAGHKGCGLGQFMAGDIFNEG